MTADRFPDSPAQLRESSLLNSWWYYDVELLPGAVATGIYPADMPMLPRLMLRRCGLRGASCLDIGSMEGLMPVLMSRGGASRVLAVDGADHCVEKLAAVQHYYGTSFEYRTVGSMYSLSEKLSGEGFDLINCSGLLYHVLSPLLVLAGLRASLKRNGLMIVSTNVVIDREPYADFNAAGRLQAEANTFWYLSTGLLDYLLRYLRLVPLACLHQPHETMRTDWRMETGKRSAYLSLLCRAVDEIAPEPGDEWMPASAASSWEYEWHVDWERVALQPVSRIGAGRRRLGWRRREPQPIDLTRAVEAQRPLTSVPPGDSHTLRLGDRR
jgi:2-polyprenyl-3-methyl-5-hydroxy-6-metoxy-1,4-benzoquinol methylase